MSRRWGLGLLAVVILSVGCTKTVRGPYNSDGEQRRDVVQAERLYQACLPILDKDPEQAEQQLREVLGFDLYHGAAHNNLGVLLLKKGKLYDAAEEFVWARKLMPGHPEPRVNLAMTLARGGKYHDAIAAAQNALEVAPGNLWAMQTLAYLQVEQGLVDEQTKTLIADISLRAQDEKWYSWARQWMTKQAVNN